MSTLSSLLRPFVQFRITLPIVQVPAEGFKQGGNELVARHDFAERGAAILVAVSLEKLD